MAAQFEATQSPSRARWIAVFESAASMVGILAMVLIPLIILLGVVPDLEAGLYFAGVALILLSAAWLLLGLVFQQRMPESE
jgi:p-aminobenzoyl-glutamate transporter AbgT